jgi:phosphotransferase system enzyme I (PtsI)
MRILQGTPVSGGVAAGPVCIFAAQVLSPPVQCGCGFEQECARLHGAQADAAGQLQHLYQDAQQRVGYDASLIFQMHLALLEDPSFLGDILSCLQQENTSAEYAVWCAGRHYYRIFESMENPYMRARSEDVLDVSRCLLRCLDPAMVPDAFKGRPEGSILCVPHALPSGVMQMQARGVQGILTQYGSYDSHSAILARCLGLPAVVALGAAFEELKPAGRVIVDGSFGRVYVDPDEETCASYAKGSEQSN